MIEIELSARRPPAGHVIFRNLAEREVRVWGAGNRWGDEALAFEARSGAQRRHIVRQLQDYTRNLPASFRIAPGESYGLRFDLGDGTWQPDPRAADVFGPGARLIAIYEVAATPEAVSHGVWTGRLQSEPVPLDPTGGAQ